MGLTIETWIPAIGNEELLKECLADLCQNSSVMKEVSIIDNGSEKPIFSGDCEWLERFLILRNPVNVGMVKSLRQASDSCGSDLLCFMHSDFMIREDRWDEKVISQFEADEKLGMVVAMGCQVAEANGGRSKCFCSFDGNVHGKYPSDNGNFVAMVDGCFLAMRRSIMDACGIPDLNFPFHHFYERDWVLSMVTRGYRAKVIQLHCDHLSGRTACQPECQEFFNKHGGEQAIYNEAERIYLEKWGHLLPVYCDSAGNYFTRAGRVFNSENL
jgi:GT2 family glycosyltransferase